MRGDLPEAALRLAVTQSVRTHERASATANIPVRRIKQKNPPRHGTGSGGWNRMRLSIAGRTYNSIRQAAKAIHRSPSTIREWLRTGEALYVD